MNENELIGCIRILEKKFDHFIQTYVMDKKKERLLGDWVSEEEILELTGLSRTTLLKLRNDGHITRSSISGKHNYYRLSDFKRLLDKNEKES